MSNITSESVLAVMSRHIGRGRGITVQEIVWKIARKTERPALERQVRKVITELRLEGYHICSNPADGYFMASSDEELQAACDHLHNRAMKSLRQIAAMKKISMPNLFGQLKLLQ